MFCIYSYFGFVCLKREKQTQAIICHKVPFWFICTHDIALSLNVKKRKMISAFGFISFCGFSALEQIVWSDRMIRRSNGFHECAFILLFVCLLFHWLVNSWNQFYFCFMVLFSSFVQTLSNNCSKQTDTKLNIEFRVACIYAYVSVSLHRSKSPSI